VHALKIRDHRKYGFAVGPESGHQERVPKWKWSQSTKPLISFGAYHFCHIGDIKVAHTFEPSGDMNGGVSAISPSAEARICD
jgi:hypothetical protein